MLQCYFSMIYFHHSVGQHPSWSQVDSVLPATALRGCSWTGNHRSVWFIFGSESSSPRRFLGITHSFKVTRKRLKCLENAFSAISFSNFCGEGPQTTRAWASIHGQLLTGQMLTSRSKNRTNAHMMWFWHGKFNLAKYFWFFNTGFFHHYFILYKRLLIFYCLLLFFFTYCA